MIFPLVYDIEISMPHNKPLSNAVATASDSDAGESVDTLNAPTLQLGESPAQSIKSSSSSGRLGWKIVQQNFHQCLGIFCGLCLPNCFYQRRYNIWWSSDIKLYLNNIRPRNEDLRDSQVSSGWHGKSVMLYNHIERQEKKEKDKDQEVHDVAKAPGLK